MNKAFLGFICVFLAVVSAQNQCMQAVETAWPELQKMYTEAMGKDWVHFELDAEKIIPIARSLATDCLNYQLPDSPRIENCISDSESIVRLVVPVIMDPSNQKALYTLLFQLPGQLSNMYSQCITPTEVKTDNQYVTVLLEQKNMEGDIYNCLSSLYPMVPIFKKLATDFIKQADMATIEQDLNTVMMVWNNVRDSCGLKKTMTFTKPTDMEQCMVHVVKIYTIVEGIVASNYDMVKIFEGLSAIYSDLSTAMQDCGIQL